jgi:RNA polymerase sigma factor (sigma-70 family)
VTDQEGNGEQHQDQESWALTGPDSHGKLLSPDDLRRLHKKVNDKAHDVIFNAWSDLDGDTLKEVHSGMVRFILRRGVAETEKYLDDPFLLGRTASVCLRNARVNVAKREGRFIPADDDTLQDSSTQPPYMRSPLDQMQDEEKLAFVRREMAQLSDDCRSVITLFYEHQLPFKVIASQMKLPERRVRMLRDNALNQLQAQAEAKGLKEGSAKPPREAPGSPRLLPPPPDEPRQDGGQLS